ncbi:MAG: hypothetical protein GXP14_13625 [Gammaproteobacteria bacterium]|nr:hypothetical protein [Gammaproteobacteria bacterium]
MINIHSSLYYLLLEALVVFILLTAVLSFFQIRHYLKRKKTLIDIVYKIKENGSQRKEELIRLLKEQGLPDEEQLLMISSEIMKNETIFYQYIVHALVKIDLNQLSDLDKHVESLIHSISKASLKKKIETRDGLEKIVSNLSELHTTVQEIRDEQNQLMKMVICTPTPIENPALNKQETQSESAEESIVDVTTSETVKEVDEKTEQSLRKEEIDTNNEPLLEEQEISSKATKDVDPDNIQTQKNRPVDQPTMPEEENIATKQNDPQPTSLAIEDDIDAILDAEIKPTEKKPEEVDIDALIEEVADENKNVLIEKSSPKVKQQTSNDKADDILDELNNIESLQTEETTHQSMETEPPQEEELEELLK